MSFENSLSKLFSLAGDDYDGVVEVQESWEAMIAADRGVLTKLYNVYFTTLHGLLDAPGAANGLSDVEAYRFITAFASSRYLGQERKEALRLLQERHGEHLALLSKALARPDEQIMGQHLRTDTGNWGDVPGAMLELYNWHKPYGVRVEKLLADIAPLIPQFYRAFPSQENISLLHTFEAHPDAVAQFAGLIRFYLLDRENPEEGPMQGLSHEMLGFFADRDQFAHANSVKILTTVLADAGKWPLELARSFIDSVVLLPLDVHPVSQQQAAAEVRQNIAAQHRLLAKPYKAHLGISAAEQKQFDEKYLGEYEAKLALIEGDFDAWNARRRRKAVQRIAVSRGTGKALDLVLRKLPEAVRAPLQSLLDEAAIYAGRPKRFPMPKASDNRFKDFGLKLLVIEELMYRQQVLAPMFNIGEFAEEYEKREISVEADGYEIIPEVALYFRNLPIADDLLARVETLHQSSGLDGGSAFMSHLYPFWDPGVGDEAIAVTNKAAVDLALLPNLRRITGLENSKPSRTLLNALKARGVELLREEG